MRCRVQHFQEVAFVMDNVNGYGYEPVGLPFMYKPQSYVDLASLMSRSWASFFATMDPNAWKAMNARFVSPILPLPERPVVLANTAML